MLFISQTLNTDDINTVNNLVKDFDSVSDISDVNNNLEEEVSPVSKYLNSFVTGYYQKSVEDIENTKIGNKITRKRNLAQVMKESFFYGSNRFGNNFIA